MKNLDQIRAANALAYCRSGADTKGKEGGNVLKKLPALIMGNGLLAAGAFAYAQRGGGWVTCFDHIARHLSHKDVGVVANCPDLRTLMDTLVGPTADSQLLKLATEETLAWLAFARRFETSGEDDDHDSNG